MKVRPTRWFLYPLVVALLTALAAAQTVDVRSWEFLTDPAGTLKLKKLESAAGWRPARAGLSWQAQFDDLRTYAGVGWYRTSIEVPHLEGDHHVLLRFGAVDYRATVFVNGKKVGEHDGGYTPFQFDITDHVHHGTNEIVVRVVDPPSQGEVEGLTYAEIPHGKQSWYVQTSGLWQPVTVEFRPATYIDNVRVTPQIDGAVKIEVAIAGKNAKAGSLAVTVRDRHGMSVMSNATPVADARTYEIDGRVDHPELWSPDDPALYTVDATLGTDSFHTHFGFRRLEARKGKLFLNGKPFYMMGALDQDFYPETIYSPPSADYIRREMETGRKLGLNTLRCHIKVCEPEYLDAADEAGMLVWYEIPNWDQFDKASADRGLQTLDAMVARDWNHPSIVIQSIINESWGIDLTKPDERKWLAGMYERAHAEVAPLGRLIVDNSACCTNFHVHTDINDFHQYFAAPDHLSKWIDWVADFATNPAWTFSQYGDSQKTGNEPLIVSEFGTWGLPELPDNLPWWFTRDAGRKVTRPQNVRERFAQYKFGRIFPDYNALARATEWNQLRGVKREIEDMRRQQSIQGYVVTEFTDINWEGNGYLTMWRDPKVYAEILNDVQQPDVILARLDRHNFWAGDSYRIPVALSHFGDDDFTNATVFWWTTNGQSGRLGITQTPAPGSVTSLGEIEIAAGSAPERGPGSIRIYLEVRNPRGETLAANQYVMHVFSRLPQTHASVALYDPAHALPQLSSALQARGYILNDFAKVMLATRWDDHVSQFVAQGGRAVVLADAADALPSSIPVHMQERKDEYDGDWVSNFAWILPQSPVFRDVALTPILGWEGEAVTPRFVMTGVPAEQFDDVLAGMFYGWLRDNSPLMLQARVGNGAVVVTTFRFERYGPGPYATTLLDSLVRYVSSSDFHPNLEWRP